ncbi:MAG: hypothetical protein IJG47_07745 [Microbacterium sp.]|nr:hypothetical protein [Microbacterium sp.]
MDDALSDAIVAFVGWDTDASIPGRHPDRIVDVSLRERVLKVVRAADAERPDSRDLGEWGRVVGARVAREHPDISPAAVRAIVALVTYEWR